MRFRELFKRLGVFVAAGTGIALLSGAAFERISRERVAREFRAPGRYVSVTGRRIQLDCRGSGSPTVVFESGLDHFGSLSWTSVHDSIAATTRACAYSRAGIMWSENSATAFDVDTNAAVLHEMLGLAGEHAPYVLVAHSLGGPYATVFTSRYPSEVVGLVMVDVTHPGQFPAFQLIAGKSLMPTSTLPRIGATLGWTGLTRVIGNGRLPAIWPRLLHEAPSAFLPTSLAALAGETEAIPRTLARAASVQDLGNRPLIVLYAGAPKSAQELETMRLTAKQGAQLDQLHRDLAVDMSHWSSIGRAEGVEGASHYIQLERPDAVIAAVRNVVGYVIAHDSGTRRR